MTTSHSFAPFQVKAADFESRTFEGLASTWDLDQGGDIIHKGAYKRTLARWRQAGGSQVIPLVDQHNYGSIRSVLGKMVDGQETDAGLETRWQVVPGNDGDELLHRLKGGFVTGLSIGYEAVGKPEYSEIERDGKAVRVRHLKELKLYEVSAVVFPMNEGARLNPASVKCLLDAARTGTLTADQKAELRALLEEPPADPPQDDAAPSAPELKGLAPEEREELRQRIQRIQRIRLRSLVNRAA